MDDVLDVPLVNATDIPERSKVECVITTASQSPVAMRDTNSRRRSPARSSLVAISTAAQGYSRTNSAVYCSSMWFGTMWAGLAARPSRRSSMLAMPP
jgi:hypothetical protein